MNQISYEKVMNAILNRGKEAGPIEPDNQFLPASDVGWIISVHPMHDPHFVFNSHGATPLTADAFSIAQFSFQFNNGIVAL